MISTLHPLTPEIDRFLGIVIEGHMNPIAASIFSLGYTWNPVHDASSLTIIVTARS